MRTSEILNKAADLIEERGWGQGGATWFGMGGLCLEGAIGAAMGRKVNQSGRPDNIDPDELNFSCPAGLAVRAYLEMELDQSAAEHKNALTPVSKRAGYWLCHWNDKPARTAEEVIEVLRAAAVIEQAREAEPAKVSA
jgi:hypothetical protein